MTISLRHSILTKYHSRSQSHVSCYQSGPEVTLQNHPRFRGDGRLWPASDFMGGSLWTWRIWEGYWQLRRRPEHTCPLVIWQSMWYLVTRGLTSVSLRDMMAVGISETQCFDAALLWRCAACPYIKTLTTLTYRGDNSTSIYNAKVKFIIGKKIPRKKFLWKRFITSTQNKSVYTTI